ncbi:MAG: phosphatase PAP2 family protein [Treponema sp.]|nr:phosphatase PAP2 family protein [Treponema sp.]
MGTTVVWQHKKQRWLSVLCMICILLIGFSRNFLGVHTPQDVIVGFSISIIAIFVAGKLQLLVEGNEKLADILTFCGIAFVIVSLIYVRVKPYPLDYVDGKLLVDPVKMQVDFFKACGSFLGLMICIFIDRHFLHYEIPVGHENLSILTAIGLGFCFSWKNYFIKAMILPCFGTHWGNLVGYFITVFFAMVIFPMLITKITKAVD